MTYSKRGRMKRKADQAIGAIEKSAEYLLGLRGIYDPDYPNYVVALDRLLQIHVNLIELMREFKRNI